MWSQFNAVNIAFTTRIAEISESKHKLQIHLTKVNFVFIVFYKLSLANEMKRIYYNFDMFVD